MTISLLPPSPRTAPRPLTRRVLPDVHFGAWLSDAGFAVEETANQLKPLAFDSWVSGMDDSEAIAQLHRSMLEAPRPVASFFDIQTRGDEVESLRSPKGLIRAICIN